MSTNLSQKLDLNNLSSGEREVILGEGWHASSWTLSSGGLVASLMNLVVHWSVWQHTEDRPLGPHGLKCLHVLNVSYVLCFHGERRGSFREQMFQATGHYLSKVM